MSLLLAILSSTDGYSNTIHNFVGIFWDDDMKNEKRESKWSLYFCGVVESNVLQTGKLPWTFLKSLRDITTTAPSY